MAKGEEGRNLGALVVPVADIEAFPIYDLEVLAGPVVIGRCVFETVGKCTLPTTLGQIFPLVVFYTQREVVTLTGSFPLGFFNPKSTSANALPASCP